MKKFIVLVFFLSIAFSSTSTAQNYAVKINDLLEKYNEYGLFNGTALAARKGEIIFKKGYGFANYEFDVPNKPGIKFRIGSISKQFTAALIMLLVEEGKIRLDGKITDYLKDYRKDTGDKVTVSQLLSHTSGIKSYTAMPNVWSDSLRNHYDKKYFIKHFHSGDIEFEPGSKFSYNNTGYYLLAAIAEEVTGESFADLIRNKIIEPAGLENTGVETEKEIAIKNMAQGYIKRMEVVYRDPYIFMPNAMGAGSMYSTVEDMFKWDLALRANTVLKKESKEKIFTPNLANYGYGWMIVKTPKNSGKDSVTVITHGGGINGFNTIVMSVLEDGRYVALFNNTGVVPLTEMARKIMKIMDGEEVEFPKKPIKDYLFEVINNEGIETAIDNYRELKKESPGLFDFSENQLNVLGYTLLNDNRIDEAIKIFELNMEAFPKSSNVYDSMGEAFMKRGENQKAIEYYKKSLELNPGNENGIKMLKKLGVDYSAKEINITPELLKEYEGKYELTPKFIINIRAEGKRLFAQATSQPEFEIFPLSGSKFYYKVVNAQIEFVKNDKGEIEKLILYQNGQILPAVRIK